MENQVQTRVVEGRTEVYDPILQIWRGATPLDRIKPPRDTDRLFICPDCGEDVMVKFHTTGWQLLNVDPETGEDTDLIEDDTTDRDLYQYECAEDCGWTADYNWHRQMDRERQEAKKPIEVLFEPPEPKGNINVTWTETKDWLYRFPNTEPDGPEPF